MHKFLAVIFLAFTAQLIGFEPIIVLVGPPGSGKGTFSQYLKENYNYNHISAGDLVRKEIAQKTSIGMEIEEIVKRGDFISPEIMQSLMASKIKEFTSSGKPLIIDGFVRTYEDGIFLEQIFSNLNLRDKVFAIVFKAENLVCQERISHRWCCPVCDHVYTDQEIPMIHSCALCHASLIKRINDTPEVILKRIREYREKIEAIQINNINNYPYLTFASDLSMKDCLNFYSQLAEAIARFDGNAIDFLNNFFPKEI